jgi:hypothetical protein
MALVTAGVDRLRVNSTGVVIIGSGEATTSVAGNILRAPDVSGTNLTGANFEINAGNGTGTGGSGNIIVKTADVGSSGSTANTMTQRLLITQKGGFSFGSGSTDYGTAGQVLKSNGDAPPSFASLSSLTDFDKSLSANGYQKLPGGLIIQWGSFTSNVDDEQTVTFPITFPTACYAVTSTISGTVANVSTSSFTVNRINEAYSGSRTGYFMAIGS